MYPNTELEDFKIKDPETTTTFNDSTTQETSNLSSPNTTIIRKPAEREIENLEDSSSDDEPAYPETEKIQDEEKSSTKPDTSIIPSDPGTNRTTNLPSTSVHKPNIGNCYAFWYDKKTLIPKIVFGPDWPFYVGLNTFLLGFQIMFVYGLFNIMSIKI